MDQAKKGDTVSVHYTGRLADGTVFDQSRDEPLRFTLGEQHVIPGFDRAVTGMRTGEKKTVTIAAGDAYGEREPEMLIPVPRVQFPADVTPEIGMQLAVDPGNGQPIPVRVVQLDERQVILDANHPLAGEALTFDLELVELQAAPA